MSTYVLADEKIVTTEKNFCHDVVFVTVIFEGLFYPKVIKTELSIFFAVFVDGVVAFTDEFKCDFTLWFYSYWMRCKITPAGLYLVININASSVLTGNVSSTSIIAL